MHDERGIEDQPMVVTSRMARMSAGRRLVIPLVVGLVAGLVLSLATPWQAAVLLGWDTTAVLFLGPIWWTIARLDADHTREVAVRDDPSRPTADTAIVVAGIACLGAVAFILIKAGSSHGGAKALLIATGVASVACSWAAVHTIYTMRYARLYYGDKPGGVDFNEKDPPHYLDFAYLAFTIGMTFQVSDTDLSSKQIRSTALRHALISYLFGAVIVGLTINVVGSLLG